MENIVKIFRALGDETRLRVLILLSRRRICAKGIAKHLDISEAAVSQHIKVLREAGIVLGEKVGYHMHYDMQEEMMSEIVSFIEQLKNNHSVDGCKMGVDMPMECKAKCKALKNKCCKKNNI